MGDVASCYEDSAKQFAEQIDRLGAGFSLQLKNQSLIFLHVLWSKAPFPFDRLLTKIERHPLKLRAHHIDKIIDLLHQQIKLPDTILATLDNYLIQRPDTVSIISALFTIHAPELLASATTHHLIHHSLAHALESSNRVSKVMDKLGLLTNNDPTSRFLRAVINLLIQFHDLEQKNKGKYNSVEELSAARVSRWITNALAISDKSFLKHLIDFLADSIIVSGTTIIFSSTRTMDLSELFLEFKSVALSAGFQVAEDLQGDLPTILDSKTALLHCIDAIMLITGVCDKMPAAFYDLVDLQEANPATSTLSIMKTYYKTPLLLEQFFTGNAFIRPFNQGAPDLINKQAFLMMLVSHVCMRAELSGVQLQGDAHHFTQLVLSCRHERLNKLDHEEFMLSFNVQCIKHEMNRVLSAFFFDYIDREIEFCKSQKLSLVYVANKLVSMRFSPKSPAGAATGHFQPLINPLVPVRDADNLRAFKSFYYNLNESQQEVLIGELIFAVVVQAGEMDAEELGITANNVMVQNTHENKKLELLNVLPSLT